MARKLSRREALLIGGLGLAAAFWLWRSWSPAPEEPAATTAAPKGGAKRDAALGAVPVVHMDQLTKAVVAYDANGRDLFKYSQRPPSWGEVRRLRAEAAAAAKAQHEAEERARLEAERKQREFEEQQRQIALNPPPPPPPQPPAITFQFLGFVGPPNGRIAALGDSNGTIVARAGEIVKKDFRIDEIRYESVVISYVDPKFKGQSRELPLLRGK